MECVAASGFYALRFPDALWALQGLVAASGFYALRFFDALWALQGLVAASGFYALRFPDAHWAHFTLKLLFNTISKKTCQKKTSKA